jgi:DNA-binding IclR family transcriptional regulator
MMPFRWCELATRTGLVKSTILRLCVSLERFGLVEHLPDIGYRLGTEAARIGSVYQQSFALKARVLPALEDLVKLSGETASFYIRRGNQRLCLLRVDSPHPLRMLVKPGDLRPMDRSSIAQVLSLSEIAARDRLAHINLPIFSSDVADPHVASVAMPVLGPHRQLVGALALSGPASRLTQAWPDTVRASLKAAGKSRLRAW